MTESYKKDRVVIKELLSAPANKFSLYYSIVGLFCGIVLYGAAGISFMGMMNILGIIMALNGSSVFGDIKEKNAAQAREMVKGAYNQMPTFLCMPVKRESLYRYQFEKMLLFILPVFVYMLVISIVKLVTAEVMTVNEFICIAVVIIVILSTFLITYAPVFESKGFKKFLTFCYGASVMLLSFVSVAMMCGHVISDTFGRPSLFFTAALPGGNIVVMLLAVALPVIIYLLFKNVILKKKGGGWYD